MRGLENPWPSYLRVSNLLGWENGAGLSNKTRGETCCSFLKRKKKNQSKNTKKEKKSSTFKHIQKNGFTYGIL